MNDIRLCCYATLSEVRRDEDMPLANCKQRHMPGQDTAPGYPWRGAGNCRYCHLGSKDSNKLSALCCLALVSRLCPQAAGQAQSWVSSRVCCLLEALSTLILRKFSRSQGPTNPAREDLGQCCWGTYV
jgi:hypothetical protein